MTPEQVTSLTDDELSAALAVHVMEWKREGDFYTWGNGMGSEPVQSWRPPTSLTDVARCTERMLAKGWYFSIWITEGVCEISGRGNGHEVEIIIRDTEARAKAEGCLLAAMKGGDAIAHDG